MLDPSGMYPNSFHPWIREEQGFSSKGERVFADPTSHAIRSHRLGLSRFYDPANGPPLDDPLRGGDKSAPEHQDRKTPCNPFPTDVYYLGNLVREDYMQKYHGLEFMQPLIVDMVQEDPKKRPNMDEVISRFAEIRNKLSTWKLRSRMARNNEIWPVTAWRSVAHWYRTVGYVFARKAAIPEPK
ncbi:hypothetical protein EI94DRAFT_1739586 [Lactarius quietus]|nr:hypothetical protein EI94DRAFT_1739586 [Lactarius quietus]